MLVTTIRCWWQVWPFWSPRSTIFFHYCRAPTFNWCHQHPKIVTNFLSHQVGDANITCHQHNLPYFELSIQPVFYRSVGWYQPFAFSHSFLQWIVEYFLEVKDLLYIHARFLIPISLHVYSESPLSVEKVTSGYIRVRRTSRGYLVKAISSFSCISSSISSLSSESKIWSTVLFITDRRKATWVNFLAEVAGSAADWIKSIDGFWWLLIIYES